MKQDIAPLSLNRIRQPHSQKKNARFVSSLMVPSLLALLVGCGGGQSRVYPPDIDPGDAAELAMELYDTNGDGFVAGEELEKAPGLNAAMATLDTDKDGKVSEDEVAARIRVWQGTNVGITSIVCTVLIDGKPLEGATVTFDPEEFLGSDIQEAVGISGPLGDFYPSIPDGKSPNADVYGIQFGLFKVRVSKVVGGKETIPEKYNVNTVLGQEVSNDDPAMQSHKVVFRVKS